MYLETTEKSRIPYQKISYPYLQMVGENLGKSPLKTFPQVGGRDLKNPLPRRIAALASGERESLSSI